MPKEVKPAKPKVKADKLRDAKRAAQKKLEAAMAAKAAQMVDLSNQIKGFDAAAWLRELILYVIWLLAFTLSIFLTRGSYNEYSFVDLWRSQVQANMPDPFVSETDFQVLLTDCLLPLLGPEPTAILNSQNVTVGYKFDTDEGDYGLSYKVDASDEKNASMRILHNGNAIVDGLWLRQVRVNRVDCIEFGLLSKASQPCFNAWDDKIEENQPYFKLDPNSTIVDDDHPERVYRSQTETKFPKRAGDGGLGSSYPGSGYVAFESDPSKASDWASRLRTERWVDLKTRAIIIGFCVYNLNNEIFLCLDFLVEVDNLGKFTLNQKYIVVNLKSYDMTRSSTFLKLGLQGFVLLMTLYYSVEEARAMKADGLKVYFSQTWNKVDVFNLLMFLLAGWFQYEAVVPLMSMLSDPDSVSSPLLLSTASSLESFKIVNAINALVMWLKLFKYVSITKRITRISDSLARAMPDILTYLFVFCICFVAFCICGFLVFGNDLKEFSNIGLAFMTNFNSMLGAWDLEPQFTASPILGRVYFILWTSLTGIILLNFIVGIMGESYNQVVEEEKANKSQPKLDTLDIIFVKAQATVGVEPDLSTFVNMDERLDKADEDGDGKTSVAELQKVLGADMAKMFPGKSAEQVMAMFDKDGTGQLDIEELQAMKDSFKKQQSAVRQEPTLKSKTVSKKTEEPAGEWLAVRCAYALLEMCVCVLSIDATGCGAPGGVCVCPCGCVKGAGVGGLNDKKAVERVREPVCIACSCLFDLTVFVVSCFAA